ncbi:MAG: 4-hydroxy-tetrahydrodipicolinate synthase [candidate division WS1 bacterium]|nr:4-hydroxy-tetrahydrodipicolinate synthase [candidate division WS1 bacterium]
MHALGKLLTAMVTPLKSDGAVDYDRAAELAVRLISSGSEGLVVTGTTGESPTVSDEEKLQLFRVVKQAVGPATVLAGTGSNDTAHTVHLSTEAVKTGVDALLLVGPYYNKPSQEGYFQHFSAVAKAAGLPLVLYNIPGRTGSNITAETTLRLAETAANIVGVKEGSGDLEQMARICAGAPEGFSVWSGDDSMTLPLLAVGGLGVISVVSHVAGPQMAELITAYHAGNVRRAAELHHLLLPLFKAAFLPSGNPACIKRALQVCGFDCGGLRLPLVEASEADTRQITEVCQKLGLA